MSLSNDINFFQASEFIVGDNHPVLEDTLNRGLKELIAKFDAGADTQVARTIIKIGSVTDIEGSVVSDDMVYYNFVTNKFEKAIDTNVMGFIDVEDLSIYTSGIYTFKNTNTLIKGEKYYLDLTTPGAMTIDSASGIYVGTAFSEDSIINTTLANSLVDLNIGEF